MEIPESEYLCRCGSSEEVRKELGSDNSERPKVFGREVIAAGIAFGDTNEGMGSLVVCLL